MLNELPGRFSIESYKIVYGYCTTHRKKKVSDTPVPNWDVAYQIIPAQEEFGK
jgi:hypothetical protein